MSLVPTLVAMYLIYSEAESTKRTRYLIYELFFKISRTPALIFTLLMFLVVLLGITTYYSAYSLIFLMGVGPRYIPALAVGTIILAVVLLMMAKGRTLEFISIVSILFVLFAISAAFLVRSQALDTVTSEQALIYMKSATSSITSLDMPLTVRGVLYLIVSTMISFGLGAGVYYVIGSFTPEELDLKKVLAGVFILQIILSFAAAFTLAYSLGVAYEGAQKAFHNPNIPAKEAMEISLKFGDLKEYVTNSTQSPMQSIEVFYSIPKILRGNMPNDTSLTMLLMLSLYFAGLTTIIVLIEMGSQMLSEIMQIGRSRGLSFIALLGMVISGVMVIGDVRTMFVVVPFAVGALAAAVEAYPLLSSELAHNRGVAGGIILLLITTGAVTLYFAAGASDVAVKLGALLGIVLFVPIFMNGMLLKSRR